MHTLALAALLLAPAVHAEDAAEDERYLLGDLGVRMDLPADWASTEWSDWAFEAEAADRSVKVFTWASGVQTPLTEGDLDAWSTTFVDKAASIEGKNVRVTHKELRTIGGRPTVRVELAFDFGANLEGAMSGATFAVAGRMVHVATITAAQRSLVGRETLELLLGRLESRKPPAEVPSPQSVTGAGVSATLPAGWRVPLANEQAPIQAAAGKLGIKDLAPCWSALRPRANVEPDVLITCPGGIQLGVVDEHSFAGVDAILREKVFGAAPVPAAIPVTAGSGQTGFLYEPELAGRTLAMAIVPYGQGVARTWALGAEGQKEGFDAALKQLVAGATYEGAHPAGPGDQVSYWVTYRPTSPAVLGTGVALLALLAGAAWGLLKALGGRKAKYEDL